MRVGQKDSRWKPPTVGLLTRINEPSVLLIDLDPPVSGAVYISKRLFRAVSRFWAWNVEDPSSVRISTLLSRSVDRRAHGQVSAP